MSERNKKSNRELAVEMSVAGMTMKEIGASLGISYSTVYGWLRIRKSGNGSNADRHLCRPCKPAECTVYVKGPAVGRRKRRRGVREG